MANAKQYGVYMQLKRRELKDCASGTSAPAIPPPFPKCRLGLFRSFWARRSLPAILFPVRPTDPPKRSVFSHQCRTWRMLHAPREYEAPAWT